MEDLSIDFSPIESDVLGIKVGRCNCETVDGKQLLKLLMEDRYDLCRLKTAAEDEFATLQLDKIGLPIYYSGSIRRYRTAIRKDEDIQFINDNLIYELYDGSQDDLLLKMLYGTWGTYPIGYYRTPVIGPNITMDQEIQCVYRYYKKYNLNRDYPENKILFIKHQGNYVGFFALNIIGDRLDSHIGGILPPFQKGGYFLDMLNYIKSYCIEHSLGHFCFGARNENAKVQKIFQRFGFHAYANENVYHIPCFFGEHSKVESIALDMADTGTEAAIARILCRDLGDAARQVTSKRTDWHWLKKPGKPAGLQMKISIAVDRPEHRLDVFRVTDEAGKVYGFGHVRYQFN